MNDAATTLEIPSRTAGFLETLFRSSGVDGLHARTARFERVVDGLQSLITRHREPGVEILRFPPVMSRKHLEKSGYLHSFPHLLGCVSCIHGEESDIRALVEGRDPDRDWVAGLSATDLVLSPAACYPLYPLVADRGRVPSKS